MVVRKLIRRSLWGVLAAVVVMSGLLLITKLSRSGWIQWDTQQNMRGYTSGQGFSYSQARALASADTYQNDVLFSIGTMEAATGQTGYVGIMGNWIEAEGPTTKLTPNGRVFVKNPHVGFYGWIYKTFH